jgi:UDP-N-acetylglucosamine--N-acetylmuramyl-(pentapeptide) pyrophosphoryl-undecaprenol N-acetylglucosamine transferase
MNKIVWYVGGKSAGHIMPLITLARQANIPAVFITTHRELDKKIIDGAGLKSTHCPLYLPDIQRKKFWLFPFHAAVWSFTFVKLLFLFFKTRPEKVISTGGLSAVPVFLFAKIFRIPCELFELNATPGDAVKFLAPLSSKVFYCYKTALQHLEHKALYYKPYPVREFSVIDSYSARKKLGFSPAKKTICFLGGSQGSQFINDFSLRIVSRFSPQEIQVIHQAGPADAARLAAWYAENKYTAFVVDYYSEIELLYSAADLVVCRAGAGTLWELEYMNIPTCIIPLETSLTDHQLHNAQALCAQKPEQFFMVRQAQADSAIEKIISLLKEQSAENQHDERLNDLSY